LTALDGDGRVLARTEIPSADPTALSSALVVAHARN
jgi:hypothetical protein